MFYVDESYDDTAFCLSAVSIRHTHWKECFDAIKQHRIKLRKDFGIPLSQEIHAREMVRGRGSLGTSKVITKWERSRIFHGMIRLVANLPTVKLFNVRLQRDRLADDQMKAWDRLTNRIERTMREFEDAETRVRDRWIASLRAASTSLSREEMEKLYTRLRLFKSRAVIIADEGREHEIISALRRMHVHNPIPSKFGEWEPGKKTRNITTNRIIEDPVFKPSHRSYFLQLADCVAFALLKQEVPPTPQIARYGIHQMFRELAEICFVKASPNDPLGIVRK